MDEPLKVTGRSSAICWVVCESETARGGELGGPWANEGACVKVTDPAALAEAMQVPFRLGRLATQDHRVLSQEGKGIKRLVAAGVESALRKRLDDHEMHA